jgi:hypothetical protein
VSTTRPTIQNNPSGFRLATSFYPDSACINVRSGWHRSGPEWTQAITELALLVIFRIAATSDRGRVATQGGSVASAALPCKLLHLFA